ncbi:MAG: hypothetical protein M5U07_25530 [Xanthobacteraceae bacterium]|nr:hypothetical protein [Xanthobacteraceae bacterium]
MQAGKRGLEPERDQRQAGEQRQRQHDPERGGRHQPGTGEMRAHRARIDAQEGEAEQREQGRREERLQERRQRRNHDADEDRGRHRPRALAPEPGERCRGRVEEDHRDSGNSRRRASRHNSHAGRGR